MSNAPTTIPTSAGVAVAGVMLAVFLFAIDATIVSSAMPTVVSQLGDIDLYSWVFSVYMLTSALATPIFGKLSDLYSRRTLILLAIATFVVGSVACGAAQSMTQLIVFRAVQGMGGGAVYALAFIIVGVVFPIEQRARMQGLIASVWGVASVLGPAGGGFIAEYWDWRWIFWINLPLGVGAAGLIILGFSEQRAEGARRSLDLAGAAILLSALMLLFYGLLVAANQIDLITAESVSVVVGVVVLLGLFIFVEGKTRDPLLPMALFHLPGYSRPAYLSLLAAMGIFGVVGFLPLYVQGALGGSASLAGVALLPLSVGWTAGSMTAGRVTTSWGYRRVCTTGMGLIVAGYIPFMLLEEAGGMTVMLVATFAAGTGMGMTNVTALVAAQGAVPFQNLGVATSTVMLFRTIGGALIISIMGSILLQRMNAAFTVIAADLKASVPDSVLQKLLNPQNLLDPATRALIPPDLMPALIGALVNALWWAFLVGLGAAAAGLMLSCFLQGKNST
ncbi:MAG: MDR family MFS transporter [Deltaproteobacteria bacterium]|nr:MDR family MFS transporter [Deltaproteobacteria bacterium]